MYFKSTKCHLVPLDMTEGRFLFDNAKIWPLTPKQSKWSTSPAGKRKRCTFDLGVNCPFKCCACTDVITCADSQNLNITSNTDTFSLCLLGVITLLLLYYHHQCTHSFATTHRDPVLRTSTI